MEPQVELDQGHFEANMNLGVGHVIEHSIIGTDLALVVKVVQMTVLGHVLAEDDPARTDGLGTRRDAMGQRSGFPRPPFGVPGVGGYLDVVVILIVIGITIVSISSPGGRNAIDHLLRVGSGNGIALVDEPSSVQRFVDGVRWTRILG